MPAIAGLRRRLAQAALALSLAGAAATVVAASTGFVVEYGAWRLSVRDPLRPAMIAMALVIVWWALAVHEDRLRAAQVLRDLTTGVRGPLRVIRAQPRRSSQWVAGFLCLAVIAVAVQAGSFVASASDAYGYLSQSDLWLRGDLIVRQPFAREMTWPFAAESLAPLGYLSRPGGPSGGNELVPIYSPGHPMVMAALQLAAGPWARFAAVPVLSGVAVWATYLIGRRFAGPLAGVIAAILLASSPAFLFEAVSPTSDAPETAWWALALATLMLPGRGAAVMAGLASGIAILTRANLAFLAVVLGAMVLGAWREHARARVLLYAAMVLPACVAMAWINWHLFGSPLRSGYGALTDVLSWSYLAANLARYPRWLIESETPIVLLALVAVAFQRRAPQHESAMPDRRVVVIGWSCIIVGTLALYMFYLPQFSSLRFLLPAYPPLLVLASAGLVTVLAPLRRRSWLASGVVALIVAGLVAWHGIDRASTQGVFTYWKSELRYRTLGRYVADSLPERAALLSQLHSGSIRYYSGRLTVRFDWIPPTHLDAAIDQLRGLGYHPFIALEEAEESSFRERFAGHSVLAPLDWMPVAFLYSNRLRVYDPADREAGRPDRSRVPAVIPNPPAQRSLWSWSD